MPSAFTASATLTVDWPLQGDGLERVLIAAEALKEKIRTANLTHIGPPENLSTDELQAEEIAEEAVGRAERYEPGRTVSREIQINGEMVTVYESMPTLELVPTYAAVTPGPDAPQFLFVATISPQQRKAAMAEAFAKAKANARELAEAAGKELGPLMGLGGWAGDHDRAGYQPQIPIRHSPFPGSSTAVFTAREPLEELRENEVVGPDPRGIKFFCWVSATFRLP